MVKVVTDLVGDHIELFKQFSDNPSFKKWLSEAIFEDVRIAGVTTAGEAEVSGPI